MVNQTKEACDNLVNLIGQTDCDPEKQEKLDEIKKTIDLTNDEDGHRHHKSLKKQLEEALLHFDAEHHELVTSMQKTINTLSVGGV